MMRRVASRRDAMGSRAERGPDPVPRRALRGVLRGRRASRAVAGLVHGVDAHEHAHVRDGA